MTDTCGFCHEPVDRLDPVVRKDGKVAHEECYRLIAGGERPSPAPSAAPPPAAAPSGGVRWS